MKEKEELEKKLMEGASAAYGDIDPCSFFIGQDTIDNISKMTLNLLGEIQEDFLFYVCYG